MNVPIQSTAQNMSIFNSDIQPYVVESISRYSILLQNAEMRT
ncbi:unnamed protein product [Haemonchus placei]|uniref:AraC family transcriptional regulator n=1 Tax=Haemonchus placei TaxID=6290 RepID=A0A0N4WXJ6_HAEPC|nr:unnamed protein product [Haemonchus placei]